MTMATVNNAAEKVTVCQRCEYDDCLASKGPKQTPPTPSAIVPPHPICGPKRLLLYPSSPWNRLLCFFPGKSACPLIPHARVTELAEGASTHPPPQSPTHRPSHPPTLGHPPSHTGCNEAALISFVWVCGLCFYGGLVRPEFTWRTTICSTICR